MGTSSSSEDNNHQHIFIFVHGFGSSGHRHGLYMKKLFRDHFGDNGFKFVISKANTGYTPAETLFRTSLGVRSGGEAFARELEQILNKYSSATELSIIGSSLGGLYSRYAIGKLFGSESEWDHISLINFVALASPFLGYSPV
eukprot:TRINITY_DN2407_c0_g1_i1.p1 TRINITY_DN2407_c0_g1~~TRINITY_DN2407_c0_g1_i1.p1  ORF type:complete len:142 (+),score=29.23 TRINITY_DN2407_c0_g1_i1:37-462(+)